MSRYIVKTKHDNSGRYLWAVWDNVTATWSNHGEYPSKKAAIYAIKYFSREGM